ncbi:MAG: hydantoinase B/oxoprolinase family protein [Verrucomicrobiales bacterium]|nr:hydantoinase B/oxoprolinase family protein [Verrucomicrobiales bacterium]
MFKIRVDTGGTFTDCWGKADGETEPRLVKVLSSGRLRVSVSQWISPREANLEIPTNWKIGPSFFTGYKLQSGDDSALVLSFESESQTITLSRDVSPSPSIDLFTREEAPVLGARLLTGTSLDRPFPPLEFRLATTRGTNALLERKGARVAFFTTQGFADLPVIRDQRRSDLFALSHQRPEPLFERIIEIDERIDADGGVLTSIQFDEAFEAAARETLEAGITVAAIALLHSYRNPEHEQQLAHRLLDLGFEHVSVSSDLAPLIKLLPRAETAVANAYLHPVMQAFLDHIRDRVGEQGQLLTMTSAGGLESIESYCPKDSLLSGPAGGVAGAAAVAGDLGFERILTFDMGGTSTDVARYDRGFLYQFEQIVGDARLLSPALKIETVASGGGSICQWKNGGLHVGPESAGADPGPACYGRGGPLTITDVNLLLGRIDPENFGIPLSPDNLEAAKSAAIALQAEAGLSVDQLDPEFLSGLLEIAIEQMADAIRTISVRDGADPSEYALLAFGGAGPLHACEIAARLGIETILIPAEAGLLSAYGLDRAQVERFAERQVNLAAGDETLSSLFQETDLEAEAALQESGFSGSVRRRIVEARLEGQDATLSLDIESSRDIPSAFASLYRSVFGYEPPGDRKIEVVSYRAVAATSDDRTGMEPAELPTISDLTGLNERSNPVEPLPFLDRAAIAPGVSVSGPAIIQDPFSTLYLKSGWTALVAANGALVAKRNSGSSMAISERPEQIERELFRHRFDNLVEEMGTMLQRSAISTNVKERADFSCALLDGTGELITSAPHIPVHLGALGMCVRMVREVISMKPGDTLVTNHPAAGGSHLPDVTLITPVFCEGEPEPVAYIANRAHHAEIGGISPGSMPPSARNLAEEGVVISPTLLIDGGKSRLDEISELLTNAPFPTRNLRDNLADLNAQLASNRRGQAIFETLLSTHGKEVVCPQMEGLKSRSLDALTRHLRTSGFTENEATELLDDGSEISVRVKNSDGTLRIDFSGTARSHPGNLNATPAIIQSAILYVLRLWTQSEVPLNEGMLQSVEILLPECFLNPKFESDPARCPAVVGGNVETSQRVVDTLIHALGFQACSQGTMNNFLFGDETFGYYETICGGSGAGEGYGGTSGIHTHMTNTAITDPEILEQRYPVRLLRFSLRAGSGGNGKWPGGDGVIREIEFLKPLHISLLTQHRTEAPFGMAGGKDGACGAQALNGEPLDGITSFDARPGDRLKIETPGGGGWGTDELSTSNAEL